MRRPMLAITRVPRDPDECIRAERNPTSGMTWIAGEIPDHEMPDVCARLLRLTYEGSDEVELAIGLLDGSVTLPVWPEDFDRAGVRYRLVWLAEHVPTDGDRARVPPPQRPAPVTSGAAR